MKLISCSLVIGFFVSLHVAADPGRVHVDDPAVLTAMGFAADATNVWRLVNDDSARAKEVRAIDGILTGHSYAMTGDDFRMAATFSGYDTDGRGYLYCPSGAAVRVASATVDLPADHRLLYLDLWGKDTSTSDVLKASLIATCHASDGAGSPNNIVLAEVDSSGLTGDFFQDTLIPDHYPNPELCSYAINLVLGEGTCEGDALTLHKVRVSWSN